MRAAEAQDWVRRLMNRAGNYPTRLERLTISDVPEVGEVEIPLSAPLTTLCGPNGVGKSVALKSILFAVSRNEAFISESSGIRAGRIEVAGYTNGNAFAVVRSGEEDTLKGDLPEVTFIDSGSFSYELSRIWAKVKELSDILDEVGPLVLDGNDLEDVRYLACRDYRYVRLYEVDMGGIFPFFEVGYGDSQYDSRHMGMGELSALAFWWHLRRAGRATMFLIEEPEAYLSFLAQQHLAHVLAKYLIRKNISAVLCTHSEAFIRITESESLIFLSREGGGGARIHMRPHHAMLKTVGIEPTIRAIVYTEDLAATQFAKEIIGEFDPELGPSVELHSMGGDGEVLAAIRATKNLASKIKFIAAFDGDLRDRVPDEVADVSVLLPGEVAFEQTLRELVRENHDEACRLLAHRDADQILASLDGVDHHDWLTGLSHTLEVGVSVTISRLFPLWLSVPDNIEEAKRFCADLREHRL